MEMECYGDTWAEPVEGTWERTAHRVRLLAAQRGGILNEERLLLFDIRELMTLYHCLGAARRRGDWRLLGAGRDIVARQRMIANGKAKEGQQ
jgi:hypothetical protein